jgi:hypothetical protein
VDRGAVAEERGGGEELKLSPREVRRPQPGSADWGKQAVPNSQASRLGQASEELILSPKEVSESSAGVCATCWKGRSCESCCERRLSESSERVC